jgi:hypothetical protein
MRSSRPGLYLGVLVLFAGCEVPTALPIYETTWSIPAKTTTISVNAFLPANQVAATADNSAFQVTLSPSSTTITRSLQQDCSLCVAANGLSVPKPPFSVGGSATFGLPGNIANATLVHDTLTVTVSNGFNFDPLRPGANAYGYLILTVRNGGTVVGRDSADGSSTALPASGTLVRKIPLNGTVSSAGGLQVSTQINSPTGDPVVIDASRSISVTGTAGPVFVSSAQVNLLNQNVAAAPSTIDLGGVDSSITKRVSGATLEMTVNNPFDVSGTLAIKLVGASPITKSFVLTSGMTKPSMTFTQDEIQDLLGHDVVMTVAGSVSGSNVAVQPGQTVSVSSRLVLTLNVGGK